MNKKLMWGIFSAVAVIINAAMIYYVVVLLVYRTLP
jgi:hypothetical protein